MIFSFIIPVYNVKPYLRECLESVLAQTFTDWEAICVDDGSTDGSGAILDEYGMRDSRIKVIHQNNAGVSAARNTALTKAKGDWLFFLDGDDILHPRLFEEMALCAEKDVDIIFAKHQTIRRIVDFEYNIDCYQSDKIDVARIGWEIYFHPIFATAFRSAKFKHLRFNKAFSIGEDRLWFVAALDSAVTVAMVDYKGYGYRIRENSATTSAMTEKKFIDEIRHFIPLLSIVVKSAKKYEKRILRRIGQSLTEYASVSFVKLPKDGQQRCLSEWHQAMKNASSEKMIPFAQRMIMKACVASKSCFVTLLLCYLPYWLKSHGLHR